MCLGNLDVVHVYHACVGSSERHFPFNSGGLNAGHGSLKAVALDLALVVLSPNDEEMSVGRVCDPCFGAIQKEMVSFVLGSCFHAGRVRAVVGLGQAKAADGFASFKLGHPFILDYFISVL